MPDVPRQLSARAESRSGNVECLGDNGVSQKWITTSSTESLLPPLGGGIDKNDNRHRNIPRIQSALHQRPVVVSTTRLIKSASPAQYKARNISQASNGVSRSESNKPHSPRLAARTRGELVKGRVVNVIQPPVPLVEAKQLEAWTGEPLDYDAEVKKHGWKMEVPGDPYGLKSRCITARRPYTISLLDVVKAPPLPMNQRFSGKTSRRNGCHTYFLNTLPRVPASFDLHPEFFSELVTAHRMELQNRQSAPAYG